MFTTSYSLPLLSLTTFNSPFPFKNFFINSVGCSGLIYYNSAITSVLNLSIKDKNSSFVNSIISASI